MAGSRSDALVVFGVTGDLRISRSFPRCMRWRSAES